MNTIENFDPIKVVSKLIKTGWIVALVQFIDTLLEHAFMFHDLDTFYPTILKFISIFWFSWAIITLLYIKLKNSEKHFYIVKISVLIVSTIVATAFIYIYEEAAHYLYPVYVIPLTIGVLLYSRKLLYIYAALSTVCYIIILLLKPTLLPTQNSFSSFITTYVVLFLCIVLSIDAVLKQSLRLITITQKQNAELMLMFNNLSNMLKKVEVTSIELDGNIETLNSSAKMTKNEINYITTAIQQSNGAIESLAKNASQSVMSLSVIENLIKKANQNSITTENSSLLTYEVAKNGDRIVDELVSQINVIDSTIKSAAEITTSLSEQSKEITNIIKFIKNIADETNLLSLNASIEAARAGEHGKGFSVVAQEVRKLAEQTSEAVQNISKILENISKQIIDVNMQTNIGKQAIEKGTDISLLTKTSFNSISDEVNKIKNIIRFSIVDIENLYNESTIVFASIDEIGSFIQETSSNMQLLTENIVAQNSEINNIESMTNNLTKLSTQLKMLIKN